MSVRVKELAERQIGSYRLQPKDLISHFNRETNVSQAYRGRQVLELLQNADDAGEEYAATSRVLFRATNNCLFAANTGTPFSLEGIQSLIISDVSPKRLARQRYIGNKGLGFRSILTWSTSPLISSGPLAIGFSKEWAEEQTLGLSEEIPELQHELGTWRRERGLIPAPIMRFPFLPDESTPYFADALALRDRGYDTVVALPLPAGRKRRRILSDFLRQLRDLSAESLLFCQHLESVRIESRRSREWRICRELRTDGQAVWLQRDGVESGWRVCWERSELPEDLLDRDLRETPAFELALAIPVDPSRRAQHHHLCVYFPTSISLPIPIIAHATLATDDGRKHITDHEANRYVLTRLADFLARTAESEAEIGPADRGLRLLRGSQNCDAELKKFGFTNSLIASCEGRCLFPKLGGGTDIAAKTKRPESRLWYDVLDREEFPDALCPTAEDAARGFLDHFEFPWYNRSDLADRMSRRLRAMPKREAGKLVGSLIAGYVLRQHHILPVLLANDGRIAGLGERLFMPTVNAPVTFPPWVSGAAFLDAEFVTGLRETLDVSTARDIQARLSYLGFHVDEYRLDTVARFLVAAVRKAPEDADQCGLWKDVLSCLYDLSRKTGATESIDAQLSVITTHGTVRSARECYLAPPYPGAETVYGLYGSLSEDEFVAAPEVLGIDESPESVERFLVRCGVAEEPRTEPVKYTGHVEGLEQFVEHVLDCLDYPTTSFGIKPWTREEVREHLHISFDGLTIPDRFAQVLDSAPSEAIVRYLLTSGRDHLLGHRPDSAVFQATQGSQRTPREYPAVPVPDPAHFMLRRRAWVRCEDGSRQPPSHIILTRVGKRVLGETFSSHALDSTSPLFTGLTPPRPVEHVLAQLGAVHSIEALPPDDVYLLLLQLPKLDPEGKDAPRIYRSVLDAGISATDSPVRDRFLEDGLLWGSSGGNAAYFPIAELRYASRYSVPPLVLKRVPLVDAGRRHSAAEVERVFGVRSLTTADYTLTYDASSTKEHSWSSAAAARIKKAIPYLYAYRLSQVADEAGRERNALRDTEVRVCRQVGLSVRIDEGEPESVALEHEREGLYLRDQRLAFLVSKRQRMPDGQVFWRTVGELLAEAVEVAAVASDFAQLLSCQDVAERMELLDLMTQGEGRALLEKARIALDLDEEEEPEIPLPPPEPVAPGPKRTPTPEGEAEEEDEDEEADTGPQGPSGGVFVPEPSPPQIDFGRKGIVVTKGKPSSGSGRRTVSEDQTLELVELYERHQGRIPIRVDHIRGSGSFGCDIVSVASEETADSAKADSHLSTEHILRFIEVKSRSSRTGLVALSENQRSAAGKYQDRYYLYRVYWDSNERIWELAVLRAPIGSTAEQRRTVYEYDLRDQSGAEWFRLEQAESTEQTQ